MIETLSLGIVMALAAYWVFPRDSRRFLRQDIRRYRRLSEEARRVGRQPFE
jgi:hypothetical protein